MKRLPEGIADVSIESKLPNIQILTSIRMFCSLWVVVHHLNLGNYTTNTLMMFVDRYILHTARGAAAFFFLLSGFMIDYSTKNWPNWRIFLIRRFSRVFPNHWIVSFSIAGFLILIPLIDGENLPRYFFRLIPYLFLFQAFYPFREVNFAFNGVTWTLSCEIFFYLLFVFLRKATTQQLLYFFLYLFCIKLSLETWFLVTEKTNLAHWLFYVFPVFRLPEFILGVILCRVYLSKPDALSFFSMHPVLVLAASIVFIGICRYSFSCDAVFLYSTAPLICGLFLLLSCLASYRLGINRLSKKPMVHIGESSFSVYLIHQPVLNGFRKIFHATGQSITVGNMCMFGLFSLVLAYGYFLCVEKRAYQCSVRFFSKAFKRKELAI
jgi:peptidoglycan/LPS O-acetylase OafA/YrhL